MVPFWVLEETPAPALIFLEGNQLIFVNRYIRRVFDTQAATTTVLTDGEGVSAIAGPLREACITVDGVDYVLGGVGSMAKLSEVRIHEEPFTEKKFDYEPAAYNTHPFPYPAPGRMAELIYDYETLRFRLVYEIFDDMPVMRKSLYVENRGDSVVTINAAETEALWLTEEGRLRFYLESDYTGDNQFGFLEHPYIYKEDMSVSAHFDMGPDYDVVPDGVFRGMQVYELFCQSICFEHRLNEMQNMYRRVAPWVNEAPLFLHLISNESEVLRRTADMVAEVGIDMIIQSFGSGVDLESEEEEYITRVKADYDYAHEKGLKIGGYTLAILKDGQPVQHDCATNGDHTQISRCLCTKWSEEYWNRVENFLKKTGADCIEIDGPYHFYTCTGNQPGQTEHLHKGLSDCRYMQWLKSTVEVFARLRRLGVYVNTPDWFFLSGSNKACTGYEEIGYSQPRLTQLVLTRIYDYKSTYYVCPSMGYGFLPVEVYHGGGDAAKFEPLTEHLWEYDWALAQAAASGVWPCIRGKRLYDTEACKKVVKYWIDVIHCHKILLNSNTVHVYPPQIAEDMVSTKGLDVMLQENHTTRDKMFLMIFNQSYETRTETLVLPAYYTGLTNQKRPPAAPSSGSFDNLETPHFGECYPLYPKHQETKLEDYVPGCDSGVHMALYEYDLPENHREAYIDENGNLVLAVTLAPMTYTYYVGYCAEDGPEKPVLLPEGKPFGKGKK